MCHSKLLRPKTQIRLNENKSKENKKTVNLLLLLLCETFQIKVHMHIRSSYLHILAKFYLDISMYGKI